MAFLRPLHPVPLLTHPATSSSRLALTRLASILPPDASLLRVGPLQAGARLVHSGFRRVADSDIFEVGVLQRWQSAAPQPRGQVSAAIVGDLGAVEFDLSWLTSCRAVVAAAAAVAAHTNGFKCFDSSVVPPRRLGLQFSRPMRGHVAHQGVRHSFFATLRTARWVQTSLRGGS